ncbi:MAG: CBS domain-containing protein [Sphaerochaeta sp.]|uniref:CBS domain-containing protein n=1 Tax=Sphaerochaeta sp. TaxID=1972642 RepID=UPI001D6784EC|nr:CBS domain-containing protein [uncultured Sphaerochaeta sp.]MDD3057352.1 CBS domain-containing protein [Sphaerochaeta sp.]MDD3928412.1 CBS domain-containing protein [Sphaerochaeta sp.]NCC12313.1 CBS domain-containing protein [Spirochaetia bacterium]NCC88750.1 CBS domain-containing protein [Spirochaetia bacterium]
MANVQSILDQKGSAVFSISPEEALSHALLQLTEHKIGALLVLNEQGDIKGILSERDIIRHFSKKLEHLNTAQIKVREVMTTGVTYVKPHQSLEDCLQLMTAGRFRHLPVVDDDKVVGMVSIGDVVKAALEERDFQIGELEHYITNAY